MDISSIQLFDFQKQRKICLSEYKGKPCMITFWTSWCPDSQRDLIQKNQLFQTMNKGELGFVTINAVGREGNEQDGINYVEQNQFQFPVLLDEGTKIYDLFQCKGVPTTIILDEKFELVETFDDRATFIEIMNGLSKVL
ncbi:TlpA disulfide reductase family protein [Alkalihalobacterium elongatum]|uniref:TlpA disulfide reductase family protein n=1 Tax=Alkalihalobacterium elongatum TaxID=2675466 RepID=UPI001C200B90|nr:TlpA disulfide reductase family protein [Alkalihalobacterium elongatum]